MARKLTAFKHPITVTQAAKALRLRWHVVRRAAVKGRIRAQHVGRRWLIDADDLPAFGSSCRGGIRPPASSR